MLLSLDVEVPGDWLAKEHRSYFLWEFGKAPEAVVEIVSNTEGGETTDKILKYAQIGILYYAIHDPGKLVQSEPLRVFVLRDKSYTPCSAEWLPVLGLGPTLWQGPFENCNTVWLRWCDRQGRVIPTGAEHAGEERQRAELERQRAEHERLLAEQLAAQLRGLGITPDEGRSLRQGAREPSSSQTLRPSRAPRPRRQVARSQAGTPRPTSDPDLGLSFGELRHKTH